MVPFDLHYAWPQGIYLALLLLVFIPLYLWLFFYRKNKRALFLPELVAPTLTFFFWLRVGLLCASWILALFALMQPLATGHYLEGQLASSKQERPSPKRKAHDVILLIDASASMGVTDSRLDKSRLNYAKEIADQIIATLTGENAAVYAFTSEIDEMSPMTPDGFFVRMMLQQLSINQGGTTGTNLFKALAQIRKLYFPKPSPKLKSLIIISDGADTAIESMPPEDRQKAINSLGNLVSDAEKMHLRVFTIGVGTRQGGIVPGVKDNNHDVIGRLDPNTLQTLATIGRGSYFEANLDSALNIADAVHKQMMQDPPYYDEQDGLVAGSLLQAVLGESAIVYERYFYYPLGFAIVLLLFASLLPASMRRDHGGLS